MIVTRGTPYVAVIPARGGSKGIPRKNLRLVGGRPLVTWSVEHARRAVTPLRVVVSTDDPEIAEVAIAHGAEVPALRPAELAADEAQTEPAVIHAVRSMPESEDVRHVVLLQPTSPIRDDGTIDRAVELYKRTGAKSLVGVVPASPFLWSGPEDAARAHYDIAYRPRRQDIVPTMRQYRETGSIYITEFAHLLATANRLAPKPCMLVLKVHEGLDVDDEFDLVVADQWLRGPAC